MKRTRPQQQYICTDRNSGLCEAETFPAVRRLCMRYSRVASLIQLRMPKLILVFMIISICCTQGFAQNNTYFRTEVGVPYIPVLSAAPSSPTVGLVYFNSTDKMMYKYEGSQWVPVGASVFAKSVLSSAAVLYKGQTVSPDVQYIYSGGLTPATCAVSGGTYTWYRATDAIGTGKAVITSGTGTPASYTVVTGDVGKYLGLGVTPATTCNAPAFESVSWKLVSALTPVLSSVTVSGISGSYAIKGNILTASFSGYSCAPVLIPGDAGASSTYRWYYANDAAGTGKTAISGKTTSNYTVSFSDGYTAGKYIAVGVTPVAANGDAGTETISTWYPTTALVPAYSMTSIVGLTEGKAQNNTTLAALNGTYSVTPAVNGTEGAPTYKWYYATSATGTGKTAITGQTGRTHTVNIGLGYGYTNDTYYLAVGVTPVTTTGETGTEVLSNWIKIQVIRAVDGTLVNTILSSSGRIWMDRNLGAMQAATSSTDYLAYGSLYQWCRAADGHQLINWTSSTTGTAVNGTTATLSATSNPGHSLFIINTATLVAGNYYDWMSTPQTSGNLWWNGTAVGTNSPCPTGYHVPTLAEWNTELALFAGKGGNNTTGAYNSLKLTTTPYFRMWSDGSLYSYGTICGNYWSSSFNTVCSYRLYFDSGNAAMYNNYVPANGLSVRCIKDLDNSTTDVTVYSNAAHTTTLTFQAYNLGANTNLDPNTYVSNGDNVDYDIKGYLYQWGRASDGHQSRTSTATAGSVSSDTPGTNIFYLATTTYNDWRNPQNDALWGAAKTANDPCPAGYRVPTQAEWGSIFSGGYTSGGYGTATNNTWTWTGNGYKINNTLFLPAAGTRSFNTGVLKLIGSNGYYWSSTVNVPYTFFLSFDNSNVYPGSVGYRSDGFRVRCVKQ